MGETADQSRPASPGGRRATPSWLPRPALGAGALVVAVVLAAALAAFLGGGEPMIQARVIGIHGSVQLRLMGGHGQLVVHGLTPPPSGDVYEVWLEPPHSPPLPTQVLFTTSSSGGADLKLPDSLSGISRVLVTPEPAGGSLAPTHPPVIVVRMG